MSVNRKADGSVCIGVDIGGTNMRAALVDSSGKILESERVSMPSGAGAAAADALAGLAVNLARSSENQGLSIEAIGLGVAGKIDKETGAVVFSPNIRSLDNYPLAAELRARTGFPVFMENDANVFGLGEGFAGAAKGIPNWVGITLGTGTGGCAMLGGKLWEGDGLGFCGEIGHMIVEPGGRRCPCGSQGCLETFASARGLASMARKAVDDNHVTEGPLFDLLLEGAPGAYSIYAAAKNGDRLSISIFEKFGWALGIAISNLFTILGIRHAIIGGGVSAAWDMFIGPLEATLAASLSMLDPKLAVVKRSPLGDDAALIGAARAARIGMGREDRP